MSPPLQLERQQGLAASPGSADIRRLLWADGDFPKARDFGSECEQKWTLAEGDVWQWWGE